MKKVIEFIVHGCPAPKGSSRAMMVGKGANRRAVNVPGGSSQNQARMDDWKSAIMAAASRAIGNTSEPPFIGVPLRVTIVFRLRRPQSHYSKSTGKLMNASPAWPVVKPDCDKLLRSTWDAMTGIIYTDDSNICESMARKRYAAAGEEGAWIRVEQLPDEIKGK